MDKDFKIAFLSGTLAFLGAIGGSYVSSYLEEQRADRQFNLQYRVHLFDKRISIIEGCSHAVAMSWRAEMIQKKIDLEQERADDWTKSGKSKLDYVSKFYTPGLERENSSILAERFGCMQSGGLFGPKTVKASSELDTGADIWRQVPPNPKMLAFFDAMREEAAYFPPKNTQHKTSQ